MKRTELRKISLKRLAAGVRSTFTAPRTPLAKRSAKRVLQDRVEAKLKRQLWKEQDGRCADCDWKAGSIGELDKHEDQSRGRGGDPTAKGNCLLLCRLCHDVRHANNNLATGRTVITGCEAVEEKCA